jgi:hypothetical protein
MDYLVMYHSCEGKSGPQQVYRQAQGLAESKAIRMLPNVSGSHPAQHGAWSVKVAVVTGCLVAANHSMWINAAGELLTLHRPSKIQASTTIAQHTAACNNRSPCIACYGLVVPLSHNTIPHCCNLQPALGLCAGSSRTLLP